MRQYLIVEQMCDDRGHGLRAMTSTTTCDSVCALPKGAFTIFSIYRSAGIFLIGLVFLVSAVGGLGSRRDSRKLEHVAVLKSKVRCTSKMLR